MTASREFVPGAGLVKGETAVQTHGQRLPMNHAKHTTAVNTKRTIYICASDEFIYFNPLVLRRGGAVAEQHPVLD